MNSKTFSNIVLAWYNHVYILSCKHSSQPIRARVLSWLFYNIQEFVAAVNKLKANKSPGFDNILNEVIKIGKDVIKGHLVNLFNRILDTGKYPALWSFGFIVPFHKKDDRSKVENYRGITLLSALGKLFTSILNNRQDDYIVQKGILKAEEKCTGQLKAFYFIYFYFIILPHRINSN